MKQKEQQQQQHPKLYVLHVISRVFKHQKHQKHQKKCLYSYIAVCKKKTGNESGSQHELRYIKDPIDNKNLPVVNEFDRETLANDKTDVEDEIQKPCHL